METASSLSRRLALVLGTGFGTGYTPIAPGTVGSLIGILLYLPVAGSAPAFLLLFAAVTAIGVWSAGICGEHFGEHDSRRIVIDEIAGMMVAYFSFPATPGWLIPGFFIFRFYDIIKPPPIRRIDRSWSSAGGVVADDLLAGLYTNLTLQLLRLIF